MIRLHPVDLKVPAPWLELQKRFITGGATVAHLAGGALRDLHAGREPKDLDFFVHVPGTKDDGNARTSFLNKTFADLCFWSMAPAEGERYATNGCRGVAEVFETAAHELQRINVIFLDQTQALGKVIFLFDFGICQIGADAAGSVFCTDAYLGDQMTGFITMQPRSSVGGLKTSLKRYARLGARTGCSLLMGAHEADRLAELLDPPVKPTSAFEL